VALSEVIQEVCWLRSLHNKLGFKQKLPTLLWGDNEGAVAMTKDPQFHQRSKHIDIKYQAIHKWVAKGFVHIESCRDQDQTADILTKPLPRVKHKKHVLEMGLSPV